MDRLACTGICFGKTVKPFTVLGHASLSVNLPAKQNIKLKFLLLLLLLLLLMRKGLE